MSTLDIRLGSLGIPVSAWAALNGLTWLDTVRAAIERQIQHIQDDQLQEVNGHVSRAQLQIPPEWDQTLKHVQLKTQLGRGSLVRHLVALDMAQQWAQKRIDPSIIPSGALWAMVQGVTDKERERVEIRLSATELRALDQQAEELGASRTQLLVKLVRSFLLSIPVLASQKAVDLGQLNSTLLRVGVDLRTIGQHLADSPEHVTQEMLGQVQACLDQIQQGVREVASVLQKSKERWVLVPASGEQ